MKCFEVAKQFEKYFAGKGDKPITIHGWLLKFQDCDDFPRDPEVYQMEIKPDDVHEIIGHGPVIDLLDEEFEQLKDKKWKAVFTEVIG